MNETSVIEVVCSFFVRFVLVFAFISIAKIDAVESIVLGAQPSITLPMGVIAFGVPSGISFDVLNRRAAVNAGIRVSCGCLNISMKNSEALGVSPGTVDHFTGELSPMYRLDKFSYSASLIYSPSGDGIGEQTATVILVGEVRHLLDIEMIAPAAQLCLGRSEALPEAVKSGAELVFRVRNGGIDSRTLGGISAQVDCLSPWTVTEVVKVVNEPIWEIRLRLTSEVLLGGIAKADLVITPLDDAGVPWGQIRKLSITSHFLGEIQASSRTLMWRSAQVVRFSLRPTNKGPIVDKSQCKKVLVRDDDGNLSVGLDAGEILSASTGGIVIELLPASDGDAKLEKGFSGMLRLRNPTGQVIFMMQVAVLP